MDIQTFLDFRNNSNNKKGKTDHANPISFAEVVSSASSKSAIQPAAKAEEGAGISHNSDPTMNTSKGYVDMDLDALFANEMPKHEGPLRIDDLPPLLMPSADNITAISEHATGRFQMLMKEYGIPEAPEKITFDNEGQMQIPLDYPYSDKLRQMMDENPGLERELQTLNALSSHYAEMKKREPFIEEMSKANSQKEIDFIIQKYKHLLNDSDNYSQIAIEFSPSGTIQMTADGQALDLSS